ncbi:MAG: lipopolysaccharide biosynthesis protein [Lachnospiraceae bacterium]|nr:lipopolysaccharide biosynthesis protein [Lachnospiraceae bacterium]
MVNTIKKLLFGSDKRIPARIMFWNMAASMLYSLQSAILLLVVTRHGGLSQAGVYSIVYAVAQTFAAMGSYSMRGFLVSDTRNEYAFETYYTAHVVTCTAMLACCFFYAFANRMSADEITAVMLMGVYRAVDGMEDLYLGEIQKRGRLDVASKEEVVRIALATFGFAAVYVLTDNLILASGTMAVTAVVVCYFLMRVILTEYPGARGRITFRRVWKLLAVCFPIFLGAILYNYLINTPKYAINRNLDSESQAIFNILFMSIFAINLLSSFIFNPLIGRMGEWWNGGEKKKFLYLILKQVVIVTAISGIIILAAYFLGCPVLSLVFGVDLAGYRGLLCLLLCFGGVAALDAFFAIVLTVMRRQHYIIIGYALAFTVNYFSMDQIVMAKGLTGAGMVYGLTMGVVLLVFIFGALSHKGWYGNDQKTDYKAVS